MTAQSQLEAYLGEFRRRLTSLIVARGAAAMALAAVAVTLVATSSGARLISTGGWKLTTGSRIPSVRLRSSRFWRKTR
jgi:hypothetical protein